MLGLEIAVVAGVLGAVEWFERRKVRRVLAPIAIALGAKFETRTSLRFLRGGYHGVFSRTAHQFYGDDYSSGATELEVELAGRVPLAIYVWRRGGSEDDNHAVLDFGDPTLVIEGSPEAVVRELLDPDTRAFLRTQTKVELTVKDKLVLTVWPQLDEATAAVDVVDRMIALAERIRIAFIAPVEAPYRALVGDDAQLENLALQRAEVARFEERRLTRFAPNKWMIGVVIVAIGLAAKHC